jgi:hypothetical protein
VARPPRTVKESSLGQVLNEYFKHIPMARDGVLDDEGALRKRMAIFIKGPPVIFKANSLEFPARG